MHPHGEVEQTARPSEGRPVRAIANVHNVEVEGRRKAKVEAKLLFTKVA